ncbi:MAG TPA: DUF4129 domain-containing protein [Acidimicrobiia bacterium]|nr:DUF4129 domain-containing protein [Acidimicrobiia bacterium]
MSGRVAGAVDPDAARQVAENILADPRFHPDRAPRPFAGFFRRLGELIVDPVLRFFERIGDAMPAVGSAPWLGLAVAVVAGATVLTVRLSSRRGRPGFASARARRTGGDPDGPEELERRAQEAEHRGDLEIALRLRFRAGLIRLDETGAVRLRPGLTNAAVRRVLRSPRFDQLAGDFDEVAYGGRPATADDLSTARAAWPAVVDTARSGSAGFR